MAVSAASATMTWPLHPNLVSPLPAALPCASTASAHFHSPLPPHLHPPLSPFSPTPAAYIMTALAGLLQAGLMRAKAKAEAHEAFTLTPLLIGGAHCCTVRQRDRGMITWFAARKALLSTCNNRQLSC